MLSQKLQYVITGPGRSGTTFLANVFLKAGYDLGPVKSSDIGKNKPEGGGLEHPLFARANMRMQSELSSLWSFSEPVDSPDLRKIARIASKHMQQDWPFVLKDPRFSETIRVWHAAGFVPKHLFLCFRDPMERSASIRKMTERAGEGEKKYIAAVQASNYQYRCVYETILFCMNHDIPYTLIAYPRIGQDLLYAEKTLAPFIKNVAETIREVWSGSLYHHRVPPALS